MKINFALSLFCKRYNNIPLILPFVYILLFTLIIRRLRYRKSIPTQPTRPKKSKYNYSV